MSKPLHLVLVSLLVAAVAVPAAEAVSADATGTGKRAVASSEGAKADYKANELLNKGLELLATPSTEEQGLKRLQSVPQLYPKSKIRYKAYMALGRLYIDKRNYELAIKQFEQIESSEDQEQLAEALYRTGICHYSANNYEKAFTSLRKVTNQYPWSVFANEAFYYIGQCHFKLRRWANAVEALDMVGTSVPLLQQGDVRAEAGQRLFVKLHDLDLVVLLKQGQQPTVTLTASTGDKVALRLEAIGRDGDYFLGSIPTAPGKAVADNAILETVGGTTVTVEYDDESTEAGKRHVKRLGRIAMVSTAGAGFTDGAFNDYVRGVYGDNDAFLRVRDLDRDSSDARDSLTIKLVAQWSEKRVDDGSGVELEQKEEIVHQRDAIELRLNETSEHSGIFTGVVKVELLQKDARKSGGPAVVAAMAGDDLLLSYADEVNLAGAPREATAVARVLTGRIGDVVNLNRVLIDLDQKARKDLIEGKLLLKLAQIFREVGLLNKATDKAELGLGKIDDLLRTSDKASLSREIVEEAYTVKWELYLAQDKMPEAIQVCNQLIQRFPDSSLVDRALLKIGQAKLAARDQAGALAVLHSILQMPKSACKAEAQFTIAQVEEARAGASPALLAGAMMAYKRVADYYPDSPFAGEALDKIANFYIKTLDYERAIGLLQQVAQDYEDAPFLDRVLYKWVIAAYRAERYQMAQEKLAELLNRYPGSTFTTSAKEFGPLIERKLGAGN